MRWLRFASASDVIGWRRFCLTGHRLLGLVVGPAFVVLGATGSIIAFRPELDEWLNARLMRVDSPVHPHQYASLEGLVTRAREGMPRNGRPYALVFPRTPHTVFWLTYSVPSPTLLSPGQLAWRQVFLHPTRSHVIGDRVMLDLGRPWRGPFVNAVQSVHRTLGLGQWSPLVMAVLSVLLSASLVTGAGVWWPRSGRWRRALTARSGVGRPLRLADWHNLVGIYSAPALVVVLLSGLHLVQSARVHQLIGTFWETTPPPGHRRSGASGGTPIGVDRAVAIAHTRFPDGRMWMVILPQSATDVYRVFKQAPEDVTDVLPSRQIWLDQYSGEPVWTLDPKRFTTGDWIEHMLYPLHNGEALGLPGRVLVSVLGWAPSALLLTGVLQWRRANRTRRVG